MGLWQIILGVLTAAFLIFLKNAHSKAHLSSILPSLRWLMVLTALSGSHIQATGFAGSL